MLPKPAPRPVDSKAKVQVHRLVEAPGVLMVLLRVQGVPASLRLTVRLLVALEDLLLADLAAPVALLGATA